MKQLYGTGRTIPQHCTMFEQGEVLTVLGWVLLGVTGACAAGCVIIAVLAS